MTTKSRQGETDLGRNALVEEKRMRGKAMGPDAAIYSKHPAPDTSLSPSVRMDEREVDRRRITL